MKRRTIALLIALLVAAAAHAAEPAAESFTINDTTYGLQRPVWLVRAGTVAQRW